MGREFMFIVLQLFECGIRTGLFVTPAQLGTLGYIIIYLLTHYSLCSSCVSASPRTRMGEPNDYDKDNFLVLNIELKIDCYRAGKYILEEIEIIDGRRNIQFFRLDLQS